MARTLTTAVFALAVYLSGSAAFGQTVSVIRNFNDHVNVNSYAPPDSDGTVGPDNFLEFINGRYIVYDKTTSHSTLLDITDTAFWQGVNNPQSASPGLTDTHVIYDYNSQRYYAVEITQDPNNAAFVNNQVLIARTNAPGVDPTVLSNWTATAYTGRASSFADFPMVGIDANALYISTNNFRSTGSFRDVTLTTIPKADLLLSTPSVANKSTLNSTTPGWSPQPVLDFSATKGAGEFIGVPLTINNSTNLIYTRVTGTGAAGATFQSPVNVTVPSFNVPTNQGAQPDGTFQLDDGDGRMPFRGYQVGNDIWLAQAVKGTGGASSRSAVEWYRINYNSGGTPSVIASGLLQDTTGHFDYFNPSIAANVNGDVVISVTRSGDSTTGTSGRAGAYAFVGFTSGTTTTFGSATLLQAGLTNGYHLFTGSDERWGDYSAVTVDPSDQGDFWLINEYAVNSTTWANNISALSIQRTVIWSGGGGDNNWSSKPDWDYLPTNDDSLTFAGATRLSNTNDSLARVGSISFSNTAGAFTLSGNALTIAGGITNNSTNTQTINLNLSLSAAQQFNAASGNLIVNGTIANGGNALTVTGVATAALAGNISGSGALAKIGAGTLVLSGNNTYSGGTTISNGLVQLGHVSGLGSAAAPLSLSGGTLDLNSFSPTVGAVSGSGGVIKNNVAGAAAITVGSGGASGAFSGTIQNGTGTVGLIKTGAGTQTISGNNTYSGGTTVDGGTLQLGHANALGSNIAGVAINSGALDLHGFSPTVGALNGTGGSIQSNVAGAVALTVGNGGAGGSYAGAIANGAAAVSLIKTGAGTQTISGNNSYTGGTTVNGGTLIAGHFNGLGSGGLAITNSATAKLANGLGTVVLPSVNVNNGSAAPTATFDIGNNSVVIPYSGASPFATIQTQVQYATDNLVFDRPGITSSAADGFSTAVGYAEANELFINNGGTYVNNQSPSQSGANTVIADQAVILKRTWIGDTDLNGSVNGADFSNFFSNLGTGAGADWVMGDTDGNGSVDAADFNNLFGNYGATGLSSGEGPVPVPEPSTLVLAALGLAVVGIRSGRFRLGFFLPFAPSVGSRAGGEN